MTLYKGSDKFIEDMMDNIDESLQMNHVYSELESLVIEDLNLEDSKNREEAIRQFWARKGIPSQND